MFDTLQITNSKFNYVVKQEQEMQIGEKRQYRNECILYSTMSHKGPIEPTRYKDIEKIIEKIFWNM